MLADRPLLQLVPGTGDGCPVGRISALLLVDYWERAVDRATDELVAAGGTPGHHEARERFIAACERLQAALNRKARVEAENAGRRWLEVVGG